MSPSAIDLDGVTLGQLHPTDNPALTYVMRMALSPAQPAVDGAGFDNKL